MRPLAGIFALLLFLAPTADAQPVGVWEHRFVDHTIYLQIQFPLLEVWRVTDRGDCMMMPSVVRWDEGDVVHSAGTRWRVSKESDTLTVALPDTTLQYRRTDRAPRKQCDTPDEI